MSNEAKFTKWPWFVVESNNETTVTCEDCDIATVWTDRDDAFLMSMAPEMLKMLELSYEILTQVNGCAESHTAEKINELLVKVRGES